MRSLFFLFSVAFVGSMHSAQAQCNVQKAKTMAAKEVTTRSFVVVPTSQAPSVSYIPMQVAYPQGSSQQLVLRFYYPKQGEKVSLKADSTVMTTFRFTDGTVLRLPAANPLVPTGLPTAAGEVSNGVQILEVAVPLKPTDVEQLMEKDLSEITILPKMNTTAVAYYRKTIQMDMPRSKRKELHEALKCVFGEGTASEAE